MTKQQALQLIEILDNITRELRVWHNIALDNESCKLAELRQQIELEIAASGLTPED